MLLKSVLESLTTQGFASDPGLRALSAIPDTLDLSTIIVTKIVRGSDDSAPLRDL